MNPEQRRRIFRILRIFAVVLIFLLVFAPFALGFFTVWTVTHTPCGGGSLPSAYGMDDYEAVSYHSESLETEIQGYFVHGTNGITIIIPPVLGSGPGSWMPEFARLNAAGYNLFNYASRNCYGYANTLGYAEAIEVGEALDYLANHHDVDMQRIGIFGFSAGGATGTLAAARYPQIRAVIAMGGYHDFAITVDDVAGSEWYGPLYRAGADVAYWLSNGLSLSVLSPISVIDQIAPRPILLIYGTQESGLPGARLQLEAAGDNADLLVIENATHGSYRVHAPETYDSRVITFLDQAFGITR